MPTIDLPAIWVPVLDKDLAATAKKFIEKLKPNPTWSFHPTVLEAGKKQLKDMNPAKRLYILAHGHFLPIFVLKSGTEYTGPKTGWTAAELAELIARDELPKTHVDFELLVCNAGASLGPKDKIKVGMAARDEFLKSKTDAQKKAAYEKSREELDPLPALPYKGDAKQELPLAQHLLTELKKKGFTKAIVTAYTCEIDAQFVKNGNLTKATSTGSKVAITGSVRLRDTGTIVKTGTDIVRFS
jgi:hypothetical protein